MVLSFSTMGSITDELRWFFDGEDLLCGLGSLFLHSYGKLVNLDTEYSPTWTNFNFKTSCIGKVSAKEEC